MVYCVTVRLGSSVTLLRKDMWHVVSRVLCDRMTVHYVGVTIFVLVKLRNDRYTFQHAY